MRERVLLIENTAVHAGRRGFRENQIELKGPQLPEPVSEELGSGGCLVLG